MEFKFATLQPIEAVVLIHNIALCPDAENDADMTVREIIAEVNTGTNYINRKVLESAFYCCNMNDERGQFWHPYGMSFDRFVKKIIGKDFYFNRYYHWIEHEEAKKSHDPVGDNSQQSQEDNEQHEVPSDG